MATFATLEALLNLQDERLHPTVSLAINRFEEVSVMDSNTNIMGVDKFNVPILLRSSF